ncbi:hypothetical protein KIL84_013636 [Mauremys mutica]|uniref:Uncharacterized protein n=1 Tax=Mauremys mutica TaxID=74926 RepID=A0A9D3WXM6_9SAUR|nr:hypothetical protein KIL84_013636 [Mauremys mutica]
MHHVRSGSVRAEDSPPRHGNGTVPSPQRVHSPEGGDTESVRYDCGSLLLTLYHAVGPAFSVETAGFGPVHSREWGRARFSGYPHLRSLPNSPDASRAPAQEGERTVLCPGPTCPCAMGSSWALSGCPLQTPVVVFFQRPKLCERFSQHVVLWLHD